MLAPLKLTCNVDKRDYLHVDNIHHLPGDVAAIIYVEKEDKETGRPIAYALGIALSPENQLLLGRWLIENATRNGTPWT